MAALLAPAPDAHGAWERLDALRRRIADVAPDGTGAVVAPGRALPIGVPGLDAVLGGLPRGRLTELLGAPGQGVTTLARQIVRQALAAGVWVAVVDATRTLAPRDWAELGPTGLWVVRPPEPARAAWCADVLLRSGTFGLVVLDAAPIVSRAVALRLLQLARDADAALLLTGTGTRASDLGGALRLRIRTVEATIDEPPPRPRSAASRSGRRWRPPGLVAMRRLAVTIEKGGGSHRTEEVSCAVGVARRLCTHPEVPDRRPVAGAPVGRHGAGHPGAAGAGLRRARRAGEPRLGR